MKIKYYLARIGNWFYDDVMSVSIIVMLSFGIIFGLVFKYTNFTNFLGWLAGLVISFIVAIVWVEFTEWSEALIRKMGERYWSDRYWEDRLNMLNDDLLSNTFESEYQMRPYVSSSSTTPATTPPTNTSSSPANSNDIRAIMEYGSRLSEENRTLEEERRALEIRRDWYNADGSRNNVSLIARVASLEKDLTDTLQIVTKMAERLVEAEQKIKVLEGELDIKKSNDKKKVGSALDRLEL